MLMLFNPKFIQATMCSNLFIPVERVNDQLHHAVDLGLESKLLRLLPELLHLRHIQSIQLDSLLLARDHLRI